ncbi:MAG TPA: LTA synthase family protein [Thiothrix sp.]|nr:LTA synthase family protein [Thiothrix sp.]
MALCTRCFSPIIKFILVTLLFMSTMRLGFMLWQWERVQPTGIDWWTIILNGIRFDLVLVGLLLIIPAVFTPFFSLTKRTSGFWQVALRIYVVFGFVFVVFMELTTPSFINQYDARPNILFVEYLIYPKEVFSMLWVGYKPQLFLALFAIPVAVIVMWKIMGKRPTTRCTIVWWKAIILTPILLVVFVLMVRSNLDHRGVNPSTVAITPDPLVNDLMLNSSYSMLYAVYELKHEKKGGISYGKMPIEEATKRVKQGMGIAENSFTNADIPTLHYQQAIKQRAKPYNLVIILEESLGAEFVGSLGGLPLTPYLDELSKQGLWFDHLYATGTRSVRGIEAVTTGFTPTAARSVVKLPKSQRGFFTLAHYLANKGYDTSFIYGGEKQFDNMGRFFIGNGFKRIIDEKDYKNPVFKGSWGASDEDLFNKAHQVFLTMGDKPFFSLVFSSSNHTPYEYPEGRITLYDKDPMTVNNAVKYADYALGEYIKKAKTAPYWKNTVFLIIADHNSRVYGPALVPIERFHIPALIIGADISPRVISTLASQIDMPATVLSLMGISGEHPMIGHDLMQPIWRKKAGRAIMQYNEVQAFMRDESVVIMQRDKPPAHYRYSAGKLSPADREDAVSTEEALAHAIWTAWSYKEKKYRLPSQAREGQNNK